MERVFRQSVMALFLQHHESLLLTSSIANVEKRRMPDGSYPQLASMTFDGCGFTGLVDGESMARKMSVDIRKQIEQSSIPGPRRNMTTAFGNGGCAKAAFQMKVVHPDWAGEKQPVHSAAALPGFKYRPNCKCLCSGVPSRLRGDAVGAGGW